VPVNFGFTSDNAKALLIKLGISNVELAAVDAMGWGVKLTANEIAFVKDDHKHSVQVGLMTLQMLSSGTLALSEVQKLKTAVKGAIDAVCADGATSSYVQSGAMPPQHQNSKSFYGLPPLEKEEPEAEVTYTKPKPWKYDPDVGVIDNIKAYREHHKCDLKTAKDAVETAKAQWEKLHGYVPVDQKGVQLAAHTVTKTKTIVEPVGLWPMFDLDELKSAATVKLRDAKKMYQPVRGTSAGTRYFVVAGNEDLRIAARHKDGTLSVRIEGPGWTKHQDPMQSVGFDLHLDGKDYASLHLNVGDDSVLANKTLGAVLLGPGLQMQTPRPSLAVIKAMGA
jgi:hypothetical protein